MRILTVAIALVWFINGFICKIMDFVPRHEMIVSRILGREHAVLATKTIGLLEIMMGIWILARIRPTLCAVVQIVIVATMNILEYFLAPDLLLFGKMNSILALLFIVVVFANEFIFNPKEPGNF